MQQSRGVMQTVLARCMHHVLAHGRVATDFSWFPIRHFNLVYFPKLFFFEFSVASFEANNIVLNAASWVRRSPNEFYVWIWTSRVSKANISCEKDRETSSSQNLICCDFPAHCCALWHMQIGGLRKLLQLVRSIVPGRSVPCRVNVWLAGAHLLFPCPVFKMDIDVTKEVVKLGAQNLLSMMSAASTVPPWGTIYRSRRTWEHKRANHGAQASVVIHAC